MRRVCDIAAARGDGTGAAKDKREAYEIAFVLFHAIPKGDWYIGGHADNTCAATGSRLVVEVSLPEATTNQTAKRQTHQRINDLLGKALGWPPECGGLNVWVIITKVSEGHWGAQGVTFTLERMAQHTGVEPDPTRIGYVKSYFKVKAKAFESACYPPDTAGLFRKLGHYDNISNSEQLDPP